MGETSAGCVLFADVSGSTKLHETAGDKTAHQAIGLCLKLFSALTVQHGGRVVKTTGDEVMAMFPDASRAGAAARDIQLSVHDMAPVGKVRLSVRIGMHQGPVVEKGGDVFGEMGMLDHGARSANARAMASPPRFMIAAMRPSGGGPAGWGPLRALR